MVMMLFVLVLEERAGMRVGMEQEKPAGEHKRQQVNSTHGPVAVRSRYSRLVTRQKLSSFCFLLARHLAIVAERRSRRQRQRG